MKKISTLFALGIILLCGCKKDNNADPASECQSPESTKYQFPLSIGSYWIYESITLDGNYTVTSASGIDSVYVSRDTVINGKTYVIKEKTTLSGTGSYLLYPGIVRDSAGYIVSLNGTYIKHDDYTYIQHSETVSTPPYIRVANMSNKDSSVTVPAGTFNTINYKEKIIILDSLYSGNRIKYNNMIFADSIGMIFRNAHFYMGSTSLGIRLLRYHIE